MTEKQPISEEELRKTFFALQKPEDVAVFLGISYPKLTYFLFKLIDSQKYHEFKIPKKAGGSRQITAPHYSLKQHQKKLSRLFQAAYKPKASTHGFVTSRSIVTNAKRHCRRKHLINIDLENFFPSIHFGRVRGMFKAIPYNLPPAVADTLARICCWNHQLPQGAPTSPVISNMLCGKLDSQMFQLSTLNRRSALQ